MSSSPIIKGKAVIQGIAPLKPIVNLPKRLTYLSINLEPGAFAVACVSVKDFFGRIIHSQHYLYPADGKLDCPEWKLSEPRDLSAKLQQS